MTCFVVCFLVATVLAVVWANTHSSRLKHTARQLNMLYHAQIPDVLTEDEKEKSFFLNQGMHQFKNVLTWQDCGAFWRLSEDSVFATPQSTRAEFTYTLVTAEVSQGCFTPWVLTPRVSTYRGENHPALPADLAEKYVLSAPADYRLPQEVIGFLHAVPCCYVELTPHALVYHEFCLCSLANIQPLRLRVRQLMLALVQKESSPIQTDTSVTTSRVSAAPLCEAELQAQVLLKLQQGSRGGTAPSTVRTNRWIYGLILLGAVLLLLIFSRLALVHWVGH